MADTTDTNTQDTAEKKVNPWLRAALEYGPIIAFFVGYMLVRDMSFTVGGREYQGFLAVTAGFIPLQAICTFLLWRVTGKISAIQIATVVLVAVMGGISIWLNDERFIKMKPTILYVFFFLILMFGILRGQSYIKMIMDHTVPMSDEGWMIITKRLAMFFAVLAVLNEVVWRTMSTDMWVNFKTFGLPLAIFVFFMTQSGVFQKYGTDEDKADA
ncbi:inner membrane-spanning protein YciB [Maritimibacter alkaliphilus]|jgi:intracellular septation protein|uniref:Inner membrane-spanning protein YciB n=1 Tax=Maritimibacter alkaliphilus HTCC2654 TaxID=314271 RepID=A3VA96_9RHOB|nr:inner membrane-spanning protein YciB [Maritimibacter alkaliphilus]EAQ14837.1 Probable intracellular septation protein [Maritimibacter alkaliphilus HTCC2654]TYP80935.1 intracellular septation protein [Maritimibacter alkaliphilus HTCC2654]